MSQYCRYCAFCFDAGEFRCSNHPDGKQVYMTRSDINRANKCPNCGAKMDGEDEQPSSEDCDQIFEFVMERLKAEKTLERLGQILGEVFGKIDETIDDCCNEFLKEEEKKNETE